MVRELAGNDRQSPFASMRSLVSPWLHRIAAVLALVAVCAIIGASPSRAERECANNYEAFVKLPNQKAMVHGSDSNQCYWAYRAQTLKQAQKLAMANCRKQAKKCAIVDVYGDIAKQNKQVQQNLKELGFYDGPVDGKIGPGSRRAVLAYQNARNLKEDGKVTDELAKRLQKDHQILTYSENSVCRFATTAGSNGLSRWETQSKYSIYVIEAKRRGLSETRCDTVLNRTGKNSSTSYTSASICRFATKEGVNGLSQWDTSSSFAHYIAEARKRGLTLSACDTIVGRKVKVNMASIDENTLCRFATRLGSDGLSEWESGVKYKTYVEEAGKRSLTLTRCDSLQGRRTRPQAATVANEESPSTPLNRNLCRAALAIYPSGLVTWEKSSGLADQVSKAKAARLTPERCAEMLQIKYKVATEEPIGTDNDTKSAEIALARFDDKAMCALATRKVGLHGTRNWNDMQVRTAHVAVAKKRGLSIERCASLLGDNQQVASRTDKPEAPEKQLDDEPPAQANPLYAALSDYRAGKFDLALVKLLPLANAGNTEAQLHLGHIYALGQGVPRNPKVAKVWYEKAKANGDAIAGIMLATLEPAPEPKKTLEEKPAPARKLIAATPGKRLALVIGNGDYRNANKLPNPRNDASAMAQTLRNLDFDVIEGFDLDKPGMERTIREFARRTPQADISLFFYAGHGMQVGARNYLVPIDAQLTEATAVDFELLDVNQTVVKYMGGETKTGIVLLDACRDNPLARTLARSFQRTRSGTVGQGLAPMTGEGGLLIGFATSPGDVAADGEGEHSPFTSALLKHLPTAGIEFEQMLKRVKNEVYVTTGRDQQPWHNSALRNEVYLVGEK